jgi:pyruvate dehydrogenase E2 component (dihydrolipoamide acetyltransferase)
MVEFRFPDVGEGIAEGEIVRWLVKVGDKVAAHQPLVEMETDKAAVELPAPCAGTVRELRGTPGETVAVGAVLAVIEAEGEPAAHALPKPAAAGVVGELEEAPAAAEAAAQVRILPRERKLAVELGVDLARLAGSGPGGRITEEEIRTAAQTPPAASERLPLRGVRKAMARAMAASAARVVPVTVMESADALPLRELKEREQAVAGRQGVHLTYLPFLIKALTLVLERYPLLNSSLDEERGEVVLHREIHVGFAVDTPEGLLVPVVRDARRKSILELAAALAELSARARERSLTPAELKGGTFTVTNYGAIGGVWGTPVIVPPQAAILGVGRIAETAVVRQGAVVARPVVPFSLTFDHRLIDGATAQRFLNTLVEHVENPDLILLEN